MKFDILAGARTDDARPPAGDIVLRRLSERVAMSLVLEELFVASLEQAAENLQRDGDTAEAGRLSELVESQRLGFAERRATLAAAGIAV